MKTFQEHFEITEEEKKAIIEIIACTYSRQANTDAIDLVQRGMTPMWEKGYQVDDIINLKVSLNFSTADIADILGGLRRNHASN